MSDNDIQKLIAENAGLKRQVAALREAFDKLITQMDRAIQKREQSEKGDK